MQYTEVSGRVFSRKSDYVNSIVRACARKLRKHLPCFAKFSLIAPCSFYFIYNWVFLILFYFFKYFDLSFGIKYSVHLYFFYLFLSLSLSLSLGRLRL